MLVDMKVVTQSRSQSQPVPKNKKVKAVSIIRVFRVPLEGIQLTHGQSQARPRGSRQHEGDGWDQGEGQFSASVRSQSEDNLRKGHLDPTSARTKNKFLQMGCRLPRCTSCDHYQPMNQSTNTSTCTSPLPSKLTLKHQNPHAINTQMVSSPKQPVTPTSNLITCTRDSDASAPSRGLGLGLGH